MDRLLHFWNQLIKPVNFTPLNPNFKMKNFSASALDVHEANEPGQPSRHHLQTWFWSHFSPMIKPPNISKAHGVFLNFCIRDIVQFLFILFPDHSVRVIYLVHMSLNRSNRDEDFDDPEPG